MNLFQSGGDTTLPGDCYVRINANAAKHYSAGGVVRFDPLSGKDKDPAGGIR
jgi:hypothetical protein